MPENRQYLIEIPGMEGADMWDADRWERNKDRLLADHKDTNVFEVEAYNPWDEKENDQYLISMPGMEGSDVWDSERWQRNKEAFMKENPQAVVERVRYVDYWGDAAKQNRERRKELDQPDVEREARLAEIGYFDDLSGEQKTFDMNSPAMVGLKPLSSAIKQNSVSGATEYLDPKVAEFYANDTEYTDRLAEKARLDAEYESNPSVIAQREYEAELARYAAKLEEEIKSDMESDIDTGKFARGFARKNMPGTATAYATSGNLSKDTIGESLENEKYERYSTAVKLLEKAKIARNVAGKGFGGAVIDWAKEGFMDKTTQSDVEAYNEIGNILSRIEKEVGSLKAENITEEVFDKYLSKDEQALIKAFFEYNSAMAEAQQDMSGWYKGGKIFAESVPFMLEFLATGGLYKAAGRASTRGLEKALVKWITKSTGKSVASVGRKVLGSNAIGFARALAGTGARTLVSPGTYDRMAEASIEIDDEGHLHRAKNAAIGFADMYVENLSEISGGLIGKGLGYLGKGAGSLAKTLGGAPLAKFGRWLGDQKLVQGLVKGWSAAAPKLERLGFHGLPEEIGEEFIGNTIREFGIQPGALEEMVSDDNFGAMLIGFAPMTLLGAAGGAISIGVVNAKASKLGEELRQMFSNHHDTKEIDSIMQSLSGATTAKEIKEMLKPMEASVMDALSRGMITREQAIEEIEMLYQYGGFIAQNNALLFGQQARENELATAKRAEMADRYGRFWQQDETETVEVATLNNGNTVFVTSAPAEDGKITIVDAVTGKKGFANTSDIVTREVDGEQIQATNKMSMAAFLNGQIAMQRKTEEETRMANERNAQIDALRAQVTPGTRINLGTEGSPVYVFAKKVGADGVTVVDETGMETRLGWDQAADALGQPIVVETDQQKLDAEISARLQRLAERRMQSRVAPATQTATEDAAQETAEAVAQEQKHIPMNEDGTVNEAAFWMQDPEGYVQWNDEQNKDGGQDSLRQIAIAKQELIALLAEAATGQNTSNPTMRKAAEKEVAIIQDKIAQLEAMEQRYAETLVENVKQTAATPTATMSEEQLEQMDAQYQGILSMTRVPSERVRVMQEYLDKIAEGSMPIKVLTAENYEEVMKAANCPEADIARVKSAIQMASLFGTRVAGFASAGTAFVMADTISDIEEARITYVHERQHILNSSNNQAVALMASALGTRENALEVLSKFVNPSGMQEYRNDSLERLADEIICRSLEIAYTSAEFSLDLQNKGIPQEVINIINNINDEQQRDKSLTAARRASYANGSSGLRSGEDGRNLEQVSGGVLGQEEVGSSRTDNTGVADGGQIAEPGSEVISDGEAENNAAAAQGEGNGLHDDGTAGSGQAEDAGDTEQVSGGSLGLQGAGPYDGGAQGDNGSAGDVEPGDGVSLRVTKPEDNLSDETKKELAEKGLVMDGGAIMSEGYDELKKETGYETPIERDPDLDSVRFSYGTRHAHIANYLKHPEAEERVVALLERFAERLSMNELVNGVISTSTKHKYGKKLPGSYAGPLRTNVEYIVTFDLDTTCPRTFQYLNLVKRIEKKIGRPLTQTECIQLIEMMRMYGQQIPCVYCYAENKRQALKDLYTKFIEARHAVLSAKTDEEALPYMYGHKPGKDGESSDPKAALADAAYKVFLEWRNNPKGKYNPTIKMLWAQYTNDRNSVLTMLDQLYASKAINTDMSDEKIAEMVAAEFGITSKKAIKVIEEITGEWKWNIIEGKDHDDYTPVEEDDLGVNENALEVWRDMTSYAKSASSAKSVIRYTPYTDELKKVSQEDRDYINGMGGVRMHSTNDFRIDYVFDYFQFMADMALYKMFGHTYTKSPEFVRIFGNSGYRINMSIAAYQDKNGNIRPNVDEGFDWEDARRLRQLFPNAGTMLMATSDEQIQMALDSDWIDMVIPFHQSGLPKSVWYNMRLWTDYQSVQKELFLNSTEKKEALIADGVMVPKKAKADEIDRLYNEHFKIKMIYDKKGKRVAPHFLPGPTRVNGQNVPGHFNDHQRYLELCKEYGVKPRFAGMQVRDNTPEGGGRVVDITEHPRYMILVKETARTDSPQTPVKFNFDEPSEALNGRTPMEYAFDELEARAMAESELAGGKVSDIYNSLNQDYFGIANQFIDTIIKHKNETGEDYPLDYLTPESREWFLVQRKALEEAFKDVETIPYHRNEYDEQGNLTKGVGLEGVDLIDEARKANASDIAFRFVGEKAAQRTDAIVGSAQMISALHTAQEMERQLNPKWSEKKNAEALRIKMATGWEKGVDGLWRYETPDFTYKGKPDGRKEFMLPELIEDDSLFIQYPELKDARVVFADLGDNVSGKASIDRGSILIEIHERLYRAVNPAWTEAMERFRNEKPEAAKRIGSGNALIEDTYDLNDYVGNLEQYTGQFGGRETMAHEIQHVIQEIEGFALGGGAETFDTHDPQAAQLYGRFKDEVDEVNRLAEESQKIQQKIGLARFVGNTSMEQSLQAQAQQIANEYAIHYVNYQDLERILAGFGILGEDGYERLAGEVESDNVVRRLDMTPEERMQSLIADTQKMDHASQIILRNNLMVDFTEDMLSFRITPRTDEQREKLFEDAKAHYGVTKNFNAAGYMLPDGSLLDFSEANDGGDPNSRSLDHRDIEGIIMDNGVEYDSRWMYIADFMNEGAIRLLPESAGINMTKAPTEEQRKKIFDFIYKYNGEVILEINDERLNSVVYMEYDRRTSPARIFRDIDGYFNEGIVPQQDVRFRVSNENQAIFVSNAAKAVEEIKQEKATPEQWLKMIEKNGGLKAGEDKWMGLSDWLKASDKKTLTKQEVLDFIKENMIQIEDVHYSRDAEDDAASQHDLLEQRVDKRYKEILNGLQDIEDYDDRRLEAFKQFQEELGEYAEFVDLERYGVYLTFPYEDLDKHIDMAKAFGVEVNLDNPIHETRRAYTTGGLENLHEIALTVPTIERWNAHDDIHFGDAGDGRAVAWIRFGDTQIIEEGSLSEYAPKNDVEREIKDYIEMGMNRWGYPFEECVGYAYNQITDAPQESVGWTEEAVTTVAEGMRGKARRRKVLVIDEIQSKRHQEGREKGYKKSKAEIEQYLSDNGYEVKEDGNFYNFYKNGELERRIAKGLMHNSMDKAKRFYVAALTKDESYNSGIPDAPFDKNWHELAMKRMLRYAAENGYDVIAWTKGDQQAERYEIGKVVSGIYKDQPTEKGYQRFEINSYTPSAPRFIFTDNEGKIVDAMDNDGEEIQDYVGKKLSEVFGKDLAIKMLGAKENTMISHDEMRIGGEGMRGFYDKMLPAFMNKYGKKWGVKVEDIELPNLEKAGQSMHSIPVTEEMKASVMEGQVMFRTTEITPEVRDEMDVIAATAIVNGHYLKAPNGKDTNLTPEQWAMVRTKGFYEWFKDSKVVDENGEPRVVFHGTEEDFTTFDEEMIGENTDTGFYGRGFYFATTREEAQGYGENVMDVFLSLKNPLDLNRVYAESNKWDGATADGAVRWWYGLASIFPEDAISETVYANIDGDEWTIADLKNRIDELAVTSETPFADATTEFGIDEGFFDMMGEEDVNLPEELTDALKANGYDGVINAGAENNEMVALYPSQIKSATDNTGAFSNEEEDIRFSIRTKPAPEKTGIGYKVFYLKDGKLYPPMVANQGGVDTPVGVWLDAEEGTRAGVSKTGRKKVKAGGKGTQGGGGTLSYRPGWHLGEIPYALQFNRKDENGEKTLFPANFVWAEVEYANDIDYQEEAMSYGYTAKGKFQHSLAGLPKLPTDGSYRYRTNPNPETDPWIITGAMKVKRLLTPSEVDQMVIDAGREPQERQEGAVTDEQIEALNKELGLVENKVSFRVNENPTEAQKEAGNYKMGHLNLDGYRITIENPKGSVRRGTDSKGNAWENTLNNDYGYIRGTEGVDGDHIDVYLSDNPSEGNVFVIDQVNPETREFDEHKVMYGFNSAEEAREAYLANFSEGWNGLGTITEVSKDEFKKWIQSSHRKTKPFSEYKSVNAISMQSEGISEAVMTGTPTDEVVASGLSLSPAQTADLAGNIFAALPESARAEVTASLNGDILGLQDAIMQIPARLAMKENWDEADKELASVVREKVQDIVDANGPTSRPLTTKEALWMLHNTGDSYDLISAATDAIVARNLGFDPESIRRRKDVDDYIRFRAGSQGAIDAATDMYNYETSLWTERLKESWSDMNLSVVALQNAISQASGMPIEPWENVVYALNRLSSKSYADKQKYLRDYLMPLWDTILDIVKHDHVSIEEIERYMMLKHALERNEIFAKRDAKEFYRGMYEEVARRMKSQSHAEKVVALSEAKKALADIDAQIATASGAKLQKLKDERVNAQYKVDVADLALRGDEKQNEKDLQDYYDNIDAGTDPKYREFREKDYGGLTSMFVDTADVKRSDYKSEEAYQRAVLAATTPRYDDVAAMESAAEREVSLFENKVYMYKALWDKVNAATKETLRHQYESGMITVEQYEAVRDMFEHYVPLRGFADNTAEDMYSYYMNNSSNGFSMPIIGAKGRKTRAESPLGWIGTMAESAIQADNKNEAKMCLYYAVLRRPDQNLLSITDTWFEYSHTENGKKVYKPAYPPKTDRVLNADELRQHMEDWEKDMKSKQAQGKAFKGTQAVNLRGSVIFQDDKQEKEHIIRVKVAGKDYSILINGNPRAAQAINGLLNPDANVGPVREWLGWARRGLSSLLTSFSPLFWVANYQRDLLSSTMRTSEAHGWGEAMRYLANRRKAWRVASYIYKHPNGTLGNSYYENLYKEFAENGGITGYTALTSNKEYEKLLADYANEASRPSVIKWAKDVFGKFMSFGEAIEQVSRFAAFITARESGKPIEEAINAAKEVSVNFNRKGSAQPISRDELEKLRTKDGQKLNGVQKVAVIVLSAMPSWLKELYFFFNASVQAISSSIKLATKSPGTAAAWAGAYFGMSIAMAWINYLLGDDDDDEYLDLPDYLRHSTVLIKVGDEYYIKWSIPQEMRPFYAWADMLVSKMMGKMPHKNLGKEMALAAAQWLPVNPFEAEDPLLSLVPDVLSPVVEAAANKTSFGGKIYDDMAFKSEGTVQDVPAFRKATDKTGKVYVELSEILNAISGGDEVQKGWANINPAALEHLVEGYGGGIYDFAKMMVTFPGLVIDAATGEKEMEIKNIPFVNKVVMSVDETNMYSHTNDAFYHYKGIAESAKRIEKEYAESDDPSRAEAYREEEDWRIYLLYKQYEKDFKDVKERLDNAVDETETDLLKQEQNVLREMFLNDIAKGELPEVTFEIREDIKRIEKDVKKIMKPADDANKERLERKKAGDVDGMVRAIERRDSLKDTPEYQRAEEISKEVKAIKKQLQELGTVERRSQRDSVIGELQRNYERLKGRMSDEISQLP